MTNQLEPPLTETVFYILLAVRKPLHGYGIIQEVEEITNKRIQLGPGTLYGAIKSLVQKELIELVNEDLKTRRKEYLLTEKGLILLKKELKRLQELLQNGTEKLEVSINDDDKTKDLY
ncbi:MULTISPECIES: PadR family transcriptional regulator [Allobacillus]|uniref:PadR family transcriptional regulator n=1 Tax=Allobacillus halotolerans TaxID=570278 RepID=A0ABS6GNR3_9BACI|nr:MULTISPECIES: PadR family transcriptional regulator [Allobacillus]MBU6080759.1 PadR family transcriptional regulator [Allobacillus halotolerans]TSJ60128.1 PadR family transcriptional regulator [Allobacillus sp. SKP2-8]